MGRKQFRRDLAAATQAPPLHVSGVETTDDGEISCLYHYTEAGTSRYAALQLLALNVDDYPHENEYMIFARDGDIDPAIIAAFEALCAVIRNQPIPEALAEISARLSQAVTSGLSSVPVALPSTSDAEDGDGEEDEDGAEDWLGGSDDETFGFNETKQPTPVTIGRRSTTSFPTADRATIKADLRDTKEAGFKVGVIGDLNTSGIVSAALRVSKLGISEEVMKAWGIRSKEYFVLLIKFQNGYRGLEEIKEESVLAGSTEIRLGLSLSYKPNAKSAFDAFNEVSSTQTQESQHKLMQSSTDLRPLFVGRPLNDLFRARFPRIVKFREVYCLRWSGAEQLVHDSQGAMIDPENMEKYDSMVDDDGRALPAVVMADSLSDQRVNDCALPLVAMQFALRHFVRCTEFCLVCHCKSGSTFEALKPYVCSNPLCLFQYMALGFGPSIEWEILSQPYVVDLLVSFCYIQAQAGRLKDFPIGIDLRVPALPQFSSAYMPQPNCMYEYNQAQSAPPPTQQSIAVAFSVPYNAEKRELRFTAEKVSDGRALRRGDFIALTSSQNFAGVVYHRVEEIMLPSVRLGPPVRTGGITNNVDATPIKPLPAQIVVAECYLFNQHFDELSDDHKAKAILELLDTIPPVKEMLNWLKTHNIGQDSTLTQWRDRISPSALNILRWIIASNRSCIMQVDMVLDSGKSIGGIHPSEDRVSGMDEYMQFRFAQGAPDKEQRFIDSVAAHTTSKDYPTIFAWHGSPLSNWHSIIREGLHFKDTLHGRVYGHGVYMSPQANTSLGYSCMYGRAGGPQSGWQNSELKISSAMSLNEIVNNPGEFKSTSPHYVVDKVDWIQTRYLLVKTNVGHTKTSDDKMANIPQDPARSVYGHGNKTVEIPVTAVSKSRRPKQDQVVIVPRKRKSFGSGSSDSPIEISDDESIATLDEDREYFLDDESYTGQTPISLDSDIEMGLSDTDFGVGESPRKRKRRSDEQSLCQLVNGCLLDPNETGFCPGQLDMTSVQRLPPPEDASHSATSSLLKAFSALVKTQSTTLAHELGWYINPEQVDNMYQWIVELHSFDKHIPLAQDMKQAGINSIVLEMRFTNSWPFAPPFVRVIKPRFLPFNHGGGGHVTEGGAICMELLTNNGWSAVSTIESILLQIRLAMSEQERPGRLAGHDRGGGAQGVYGVGEAIMAYERACRTHGWEIPESFSGFRQGNARQW